MENALNKLLIHLKNIIFFKFIVFLFATLGLLLFISNTNIELKRTEKHQKKVIFALKEVEEKLDLIQNFDRDIYNVTDEYNNLILQSKNQECESKKRVLKYISSLYYKYKLYQPINTKISHSYNYSYDASYSTNLLVEYHVLNLFFQVFDKMQLLAITEDLYNHLPQGSIIIKQEVNIIDAITPEVASQLEKNKIIPLINVNMKIMLRNVKYKSKVA
ncbi:MAG TPA: hypothetical protein QKA08_04970 [Candidatus Megaira endosymbiont of Nemacystus decipiens]|nr:hypothetical protein [Candidatus Megaera endosymbiont of Nemacystus decipiens]